jgi:SAM-dependent methyltransferase
MLVPAFHLDRARAESFGAAADAYDRYRPNYPAALLDDLAALGATAVLDVGCGTGKVARGLAHRGVNVLGVEVDPQMAAVASRHGVAVEVARFEDWDDAGRRFDVVTCGDTWHWIDPDRGADAVARVLRAGGTFARFWNLQLLDDEITAALAPVYAQHAPEVLPYGVPMPPLPEGLDPWALAGPFTTERLATYPSERHVTGAEWAAFAGTISDHRRLPAARLAALQAAIRATIDGCAETIRVRIVTSAHFARRT